MENQDRFIHVDVLVKADRAQVWDAYLDPEWVKRWNFASSDWCCPAAVNDVRPGGEFSYRMEARDGSFGFDFQGHFVRIEKPFLLEYELGDGRNVRLEFVAEGAFTRVHEMFEPETENSRELQEAGWKAILENFARCAEAS